LSKITNELEKLLINISTRWENNTYYHRKEYWY
jgi:hypothetical protein